MIMPNIWENKNVPNHQPDDNSEDGVKPKYGVETTGVDMSEGWWGPH